MVYKIINKDTGADGEFTNDIIAEFLEIHLDHYGDEKDDILKCIDYVFNKGGFITLAISGKKLLGAVIIVETGMEGFIPENILVYIAVNESQRGNGLGKYLLDNALNLAKGSIALHVESDNPAKKLYERFGFTNKYLEMRLQR